MPVETITVDLSAEDGARADRLARDMAGLDALDRPAEQQKKRSAKLWAATWPRLLALALFIGFWQVVVWSKWRPDYVLPGPGAVARRLLELASEGRFWQAVATTVRRGFTGFAFAVAIGTAIAITVSRFRALRTGVGSFISGLQSMPSIAWFPLAVLLFQLNESAIFFVVVIGAAPSIAGGLLIGIDHVPPLQRRAGHVLGARGLSTYRHVVLPAALPAYVAGLRQGWAFAWRSLMAGELLVIIANRPSLGARLQFARELADSAGLIALMIVVLLIGITADAVFSSADRALRKQRGLGDA